VSEGRDANQREEPYVRQKERKEGVRPARDDEIHKGVKARGMYSTHIPCGDRGYLNNRHHGNASDGGEGEEREDAKREGSLCGDRAAPCRTGAQAVVVPVEGVLDTELHARAAGLPQVGQVPIDLGHRALPGQLGVDAVQQLARHLHLRLRGPMVPVERVSPQQPLDDHKDERLAEKATFEELRDEVDVAQLVLLNFRLLLDLLFIGQLVEVFGECGRLLEEPLAGVEEGAAEGEAVARPPRRRWWRAVAAR